MKRNIFGIIITLSIVICSLTILSANISEEKVEELNDHSFVEYENQNFVSEKENVLLKIIKKMFNAEDTVINREYVAQPDDPNVTDVAIPVIENDYQPQKVKQIKSKMTDFNHAATSYYIEDKHPEKHHENNTLLAFVPASSATGGNRSVGASNFDNAALSLSTMLSITQQNAPKGTSDIDPKDTSVTPGDIGDQDIPGPVGDGLSILIVFSLVFVLRKKIKFN